MTVYYNTCSNLIWRTVSRLVDEAVPLDHPRRFPDKARLSYYYNNVYAFCIKPYLVGEPKSFIKQNTKYLHQRGTQLDFCILIVYHCIAMRPELHFAEKMHFV